MDARDVYNAIEALGMVAGMRGQFTPEKALRVTGILMEHGIHIFEPTMNSTQPIETMQAIKREYGDEAIVGMGTVLDTDTARRALDAGADFLVSPAFAPDVVVLARTRDVMMIPGVVTPTEAVNAWEMGVSLLKLFPVGALGVDYFKAMFGPLDHMKFMCNGAMNAQNAHDFLAAGAVAAGMSGWLTGDGDTELDLIRRRAQMMVEAIHMARTGQRPPRTI